MKLVNTNGTAQKANLHFKDFERKDNKVHRHLLSSGSGNDENIMQAQKKVYPNTTSITPSGNDPHTMTYNAPAYSLSILEIPITAVTAEDTEPEGGYLSDGTPIGWIDITDCLTNSDFSDGKTGWRGTAFSAAPGTVAEYFNTNFNSYQVLTDMPAGEYMFSIDGFYRQGSIETAHSSHTNGTEKLNAEIYMTIGTGTNAQSLMSLYDEHAPYTYGPIYTYPDNVGTANIAFNFKAAYRHNAVQATLKTDDGTLRVGLRKTRAVANDWTCFDNARLYYRESDINDGIKDVIVPCANPNRKCFDLSGRQVIPTSSLPKGIYIINEKKVVIR